jgi:hypothetical protein
MTTCAILADSYFECQRKYGTAFVKTRARHRICHQQPSAVVSLEISDDESRVGSPLPTVAEVIGGRPKHAIITGDISFDDKVYSFKCARSISVRRH